MRKRLTLEEAAKLECFMNAPGRQPDHADVKGNPVYNQFMRLTQVYEEDEVQKRQDDMRALAARLGDPRLGSGYMPPLPRPPQGYTMFGQGGLPTP